LLKDGKFIPNCQNLLNRFSKTLFKIHSGISIILTGTLLLSLFDFAFPLQAFLPLFPYENPTDTVNGVEMIFLHGYFFHFNLGFYASLLMILFCYLVIASKKRNEPFVLVYFMGMARSLFMIIICSQFPIDFFDESKINLLLILHGIYLGLFLLLILLTVFFGAEKRPRIPEPFEPGED